MPAVAAKAWDRIPPALCLGLKWNALSALWPRPSDYPARWACPKSNDWGLFVAHFVKTLCRKSPQTAVSDKVGDEVVTTMWIKTVALGQALARAMGKVWRRCPTCAFWRRPAARSARTTGRDARSTRTRGRLRYFVNRLGRDAATQELKIALASLGHFA